MLLFYKKITKSCIHQIINKILNKGVKLTILIDLNRINKSISNYSVAIKYITTRDIKIDSERNKERQLNRKREIE